MKIKKYYSVAEQTENAIKWLDALFSGIYRQGQSVLEDKSGAFCCWGVGCRLMGIEYRVGVTSWDNQFHKLIGFNDYHGQISPAYQAREFGNTRNGLSKSANLADINDSGLGNFEQIATYLVVHAKTNFRRGVAKNIQSHYHEIIQKHEKESK